MLLQILLILALSILGKDMTTYGKEEEELDSDVDKSGEPSELPKASVNETISLNHSHFLI